MSGEHQAEVAQVVPLGPAGGEVGREWDGGPELPRLEPALGGEVRGEDGRQVGAEEGHQVDVLQPGSGRHRHLPPPNPRLLQHHGPAALAEHRPGLQCPLQQLLQQLLQLRVQRDPTVLLLLLKLLGQDALLESDDAGWEDGAGGRGGGADKAQGHGDQDSRRGRDESGQQDGGQEDDGQQGGQQADPRRPAQHVGDTTA